MFSKEQRSQSTVESYDNGMFYKTQTAIPWWRRKRWILIGVAAVIVLGVGLGVGLGIGLNKNNSDSDSSGSGGSASGGSISVGNSSTWQPAVGAKWQIELLNPLDEFSTDPEIYDIDLFDNPASTIKKLHSQNQKVICYFSAGSYENFRPDASNFTTADYGNPLDGWPGEYWLQTNSTNVRNIMKSRLDLAVQKGCDGVDPDNVDGYQNDNGLGLTKAGAINYLEFLANEAQARNLSIGLKNTADLVNATLPFMQWQVNEQCVQYDECSDFQAFIVAGKPVFHIEYPTSTSQPNMITAAKKQQVCSGAGTNNFSTVLKNMNLDDFVEYC